MRHSGLQCIAVSATRCGQWNGSGHLSRPQLPRRQPPFSYHQIIAKNSVAQIFQHCSSNSAVMSPFQGQGQDGSGGGAGMVVPCSCSEPPPPHHYSNLIIHSRPDRRPQHKKSEVGNGMSWRRSCSYAPPALHCICPRPAFCLALPEYSTIAPITGDHSLALHRRPPSSNVGICGHEKADRPAAGQLTTTLPTNPLRPRHRPCGQS